MPADEEDNSATAALGLRYRVDNEPEISGGEYIGQAGKEGGEGAIGGGNRGEE